MRLDELDELCRQYPPEYFQRKLTALLAPRLHAVAPKVETIDQAIARTRGARSMAPGLSAQRLAA